QRLLAGGWPYLAFVDNKPPLLYVVYAVMAWLGRGSLVGVHALTCVWVFATALATGAAARRLGGSAFVAALLYAALSPSYLIWDGLATNGEVLANLFLAVGAWTLLADRPVVAGIAAAVAALTYPQAGVFLVVAALRSL